MAPRTRLRAFVVVPALVAVLAATAWAALPQQSGTVDLATANSFQNRFDGATAGEVLGEHTAPAGDVNGDGFDDVVVSTTGSGAYVIFGRVATGTLKVTDPALGGFKIAGGNFAGGAYAAAAGDLKGDGLDDILVGTPSADRAFVIYGKASTSPV